MRKFRANVRTLDEICKMEKITDIEKYSIKFRDGIAFCKNMLYDKPIILEKADASGATYKDVVNYMCYKKEWLKNIEEIIDPTEIKIDTPLIVWDNHTYKYRAYFSKYEAGKIYCFVEGGTQWSSYGEDEIWENYTLAIEGE